MRPFSKVIVKALVMLGSAGAYASDEVQVFSLDSSFEKMILKQGEATREPAGFKARARVIAVKRELALVEDDLNKIPQDIILNAGSEAGIGTGMVLSVVRKIPVLDPYRENSQKELEVEFARLKVIHSQDGLSVTRLEKIEPNTSGLGVGTRAVLIGDYVGSL